jgi:hypothetical protein
MNDDNNDNDNDILQLHNPLGRLWPAFTGMVLGEMIS